MDHHVEMISVRSDDASVPVAFHATCGCGWAAQSHDEAHLRSLIGDHEQGDHEIPVPASPTPDRVVRDASAADQAD